jgi:hypothetical protein
LWFGGLAGIFALRAFGVVFSPDKDSNVVIAATAGMMAGLLVAVAFARIYFLIVGTNPDKPFVKAGR